MERYLVAITVFVVTLGMLHTLKIGKETKPQAIPQQQYVPPVAPPIQKPQTPTITVPVPSYLSYDKLGEQLKQWNKEAPDLTELGTVGKTSASLPIFFIRVTNKYTTNKPEMMITGCIHGNEPHATATVMAYIGSLLNGYGKDATITKLLDERDIYFVPVVSPDSYPNSRYVDGVDPNRDFTARKAAPIRAIQEFFLQHKFKAAYSGHTWGRVYLTPWGDKMQDCPDAAAYKELVGEMAKLSQYRILRACDLYNGNGGLNNPPIRFGLDGWEDNCWGSPIYGTEVDWYYTHGAFAIVCEYGTHQRIPTKEEIIEEYKRTWEGFLLFIDKAPMVQLKN